MMLFINDTECVRGECSLPALPAGNGQTAGRAMREALFRAAVAAADTAAESAGGLGDPVSVSVRYPYLPNPGETVRSETRIVKRGRKVSNLDVRLFLPDGRTCCMASLDYHVDLTAVKIQ